MRFHREQTALVLCMAFAAPVRAASAQEGWKATFTPYAWLAGLNGRLGFGGAIADVNLGYSDVLDQIDLAVRADLDAHRGRWIARLDVTYVSLSDKRANEEGGGSVLAELDQGVIQPEVGYTVAETSWGGIDALVGARFWRPKVKVTAGTGSEVVDVASATQSWVDGTVGARVRFDPAAKWHLFAKGDVGAGGSKLTWQASGGAGFDFIDCCSVIGAYRHRDIDYEHNGFVNNTYLSGFELGLGIRF